MSVSLQKIWNSINNLTKIENIDSGISCGSIKTRINKILFALDINAGSISYAYKIGAELLIAHHGIGEHYYLAYKNLCNKKAALKKQGFRNIKNIDKILHSCMIKCRLSMRNYNAISSLYLAQKNNICCISAHSLSDALLEKRLLNIILTENRTRNILTTLKYMIKSQTNFPKDESVSLHGKLDSIYAKPYLDIGNSIPTDTELALLLLKEGCDFLITTSVSFEVIEAYINCNASVMLVNHIPFDILSMNILKNKLHKSFPTLQVEQLEA